MDIELKRRAKIDRKLRKQKEYFRFIQEEIEEEMDDILSSKEEEDCGTEENI